MNIKYLWVLALLGCASSPEQQPIATKSEPVYVRHLVSKTDILYTYRVHGDGATGFDLAEADAEKVCRSKWGMGVSQKTQPSCGVYNTSSMQCAVTFRCQ
jgi:hypothetical protein